MGIRSNIANTVKRVLGFGRKATPLGSLKRAYQGALVSRLTSDWMSSQLSADAEIRNSLRKLRDRSRELVRNNPYARQAKRTTQINIVGTGMILIFPDIANPFAKLIPIRKPVYEPGPDEIAIPSNSLILIK